MGFAPLVVINLQYDSNSFPLLCNITTWEKTWHGLVPITIYLSNVSPKILYKKTSQSADSLHSDLNKIDVGPLYFLSNFLDRAVN